MCHLALLRAEQRKANADVIYFEMVLLQHGLSVTARKVKTTRGPTTLKHFCIYMFRSSLVLHASLPMTCPWVTSTSPEILVQIRVVTVSAL